jgi:hypothetical protein
MMRQYTEQKFLALKSTWAKTEVNWMVEIKMKVHNLFFGENFPPQVVTNNHPASCSVGWSASFSKMLNVRTRYSTSCLASCLTGFR